MEEPERNCCKSGVFIRVPSTPAEAGEALRGNRTEQFDEESAEIQIFLVVKGVSIVRPGGGGGSSTPRWICCCSNVTTMRSMGGVALSVTNGGNSGSVDLSCCEEDRKAAGPCFHCSSQHAEDTLEEEGRALPRLMKTVIRHSESLVVMYGPEEYSIIIPDGWLVSEGGKTVMSCV